MLLLLTMTLAGSIPFLIYLALFYSLGSRLDMKYYILFFKMSILFYLCPFPLVKYLLPLQVLQKFDYARNSYEEIIDITNYVNVRGIGGNYILLPDYIFMIYMVFILCAGILFFYTWYGYLKEKYELFSAATKLDEDFDHLLTTYPELAKLKKKKIKIYEHNYISTPFVIGFFCPCIVFPNYPLTEQQKGYIYSHELTHVLHRDTFWKTLCVIVSIFHWYNPLVYLLIREFAHACEYHCDEICSSNLTKEQKKEYASLIVQLAVDRRSESALLKFASTFTGGKNFMKKRIDIIFKETRGSRIKNILAVIGLCLTFVISGSTVFAYDNPTEVSGSIANAPEGEQIGFTFIEKDETLPYDTNKLDFSSFSSVFIKEDGEIIPISEENSNTPYSVCTHNYVSGVVVDHITNGAGCILKIYDGKTCQKCGAVVKYSLIRTKPYTICPH